MKQAWLTRIARLSRAASTAVSVACVILIGWFDYVTGDFSMAVFYLLPVAFATWFVSRAVGMGIALLSAATWLLGDLAIRRTAPHTLLPFWNTAVLALIYAVVVQLLAALQRLHTELEARVVERTASLLRANTELETTHRQLTESKALAERHERLASLGVLAAGVAHEIRNPLTAIKTRVFVLQKKLEQNASALDDAALIDREIDRLEHILNDFLLFARPGEPEFATFDPHRLLCEVGELLAPELAAREISLTVQNATDEALLRADPGQLRQVLINLVRNATESIGQQGRIVLRARPDCLPLNGRQQEVMVLEIEDTGPGIPADVQRRLFDPFFTTKPTGTGLGLSIAMRILEKHGGTLQFQTSPQRGSTFAMLLPALSDTAASAPTSALTRETSPPAGDDRRAEAARECGCSATGAF